jgi:hypothetical protein
MEYRSVMWIEMTPDVYGGHKCNEHIPRWNCYADGDKQDNTVTEPVKFNPKDFPPGTKIVISEPLCPKCDEVYENCIGCRKEDDGCDFDWKEWTENQYS